MTHAGEDSSREEPETSAKIMPTQLANALKVSLAVGDIKNVQPYAQVVDETTGK